MLQGDPEIFRRDGLALNQLRFELRSLLGEGLRELLHDLRNEEIGLLDRSSGLVHEACLDVQPPSPE